MRTIKLLFIFLLLASYQLIAQTEKDTKTYICHHGNGTSEVVYFSGSTSVSMHVHYMSSTHKSKIKLDVLKYDTRTRTYSIQFPNAPKDEIYYFSLLNNGNMQCKNPDGTVQTFTLSDDDPIEYVSKNADGSKETLLILTSDTQHHIETIFYSSSTAKGKVELPIVTKDDKLKKYKVRFPNNQLYSLNWQMNQAMDMNQIILINPSGVAQVFIAK